MNEESCHIFYRFGSEKNIWRELHLDTSSGVLISDLKIRIAQESSLTREFARKTNLLISLYDDNKPDELQPLDDNIVVHSGTRLIINRVAWTPSKPIVHLAKSQIDSDFIPDQKKLKKFPISLICQLCHKPLNQPFLVKCSARCGCSGCRNCLQECLGETLPEFEEKSQSDEPFEIFDLEDKKACPFCGHGFVSACVKNRKMQTLLNGLDLESFDIPEHVEFYFPSFTPRFASTQEYPSHFILEIEVDLFNLISEKMLIPVYGDSILDINVKKYHDPSTANTKMELDLNNMDDLKVEYIENKVKQEKMELESKIYETVYQPETHSENDSETNVIAIVLTKTGSSSTLNVCGIIKFISESPDVDFLNKTGARTSLKFEWVKLNDPQSTVPFTKAPLFNILGGKRFTNVSLNNDSDVLWRLKNEKIIEVGLDPKCYNSVLLSVFPDSKDIEDNLEKSRKNWLQTCFGKGPVPLYTTETGKVLKREEVTNLDKIDFQNPYLGYLALFPFLSKSQFNQVRATQRKVKEQFLSDLTRQVIVNTPPDKGKVILDKANNNTWKSHIDYVIQDSDL